MWCLLDSRFLRDGHSRLRAIFHNRFKFHLITVGQTPQGISQQLIKAFKQNRPEVSLGPDNLKTYSVTGWLSI